MSDDILMLLIIHLITTRRQCISNATMRYRDYNPEVTQVTQAVCVYFRLLRGSSISYGLLSGERQKQFVHEYRQHVVLSANKAP